MSGNLMSQFARIGSSKHVLKLFLSPQNKLQAFYFGNAANDYEAKCKEGVESRTVEFSRNRSRDISGEAIDLRDEVVQPGVSSSEDEHVEIYDSQGSINLSSVMQSTVPEPYSTHGQKAPSHLNMPGGHVGQNQKYLSDSLQKTHSTFNSNNSKGMVGFFWHTQPAQSKLNVLLTRNYSTRVVNLTGSSSKVPVKICKVHLCTQQPEPEKPLTAKEKLKIAVRDYGATVVVFHVAISLISLGGFYLAVSSGLDVVGLLQATGLTSERLSANSLEIGASTFVVAYAIHKLFAPLRIAMTLTASPIIVKYLRMRGYLKKN